MRPGRPSGVAISVAVTGVALFFVLPLAGLVVRAPWSDLWSVLASAPVLAALRLSLISSIAAAALSLLFGIPLAWLLARSDFRGHALLRALVTLPMVLPPIVGGVGLLLAFGRRGIVGGWLHDTLGVQLPFSLAAVILAETFVAVPFLVLTLEGALRSLDRRYEEAAAVLGARPWTTFRRVTLPLVRPSLVAGAALAWARALGEFGATAAFAGSLQGRTRTVPLQVFLDLEVNPGAAVALSLVMVAIAVGVLVLGRRRWMVA